MAPKPPPPPPPPKPPPPPPKLAIRIEAAASVNPDARGRPSPIVVRVYELKSAAPFEAADFMSLYQQDRSALGSELVAREEFMLEPGEIRTLDKLLAPDVRAVGVMAAFRELERARWRTTVSVSAGRDNALAFWLEDVAVRGSAGR
jgi:type VI secretion system protein VasD